MYLSSQLGVSDKKTENLSYSAGHKKPKSYKSLLGRRLKGTQEMVLQLNQLLSHCQLDTSIING